MTGRRRLCRRELYVTLYVYLQADISMCFHFTDSDKGASIRYVFTKGGAQIYVQLREVQYILYYFGLKCAHCSRTGPKLKFGYYLKFTLEVVGTCRCYDYQKVNKRAMAL